MGKLKQLFCKHIWHTTKTLDLDYLRRLEYVILTGQVFYSYYKEIASYQECLKCGKIQIVQDEIWLKDSLI